MGLYGKIKFLGVLMRKIEYLQRLYCRKLSYSDVFTHNIAKNKVKKTFHCRKVLFFWKNRDFSVEYHIKTRFMEKFRVYSE